ncbi:MAG: U32 family peptidase [Erysipelotrichia bacterium]|nr:U32 family peptidase [Erysipelotrichia bacterium]
MEIIVVQKTKKYLKELKEMNVTDILISDNTFSSAVNFLKNEEIAEMNEAVHDSGMRTIVRVDRLYHQDEINDLKNYLSFLNDIGVDKILCSDIAVTMLIKENDYTMKTIYAPETLLTNSYDVKQLKNDGVDSCIISKDIPFENILRIAKNNPQYCYLRVFGQILISYSRRRFISAYLKKEDEYTDNYFLQEEKRDFLMPIVEKKSGCWLYGYSLESFGQLKEICDSEVKGIIIDEMFQNDLFILEIVKIHRDILDDKIDYKMAVQRLKELDQKSNYGSIAQVKQTALEKE